MKSKFALCIDNRGAPDLQRRKFYRVLRDAAAQKHGMLRVVDESGEDYLYPKACFVEVALPARVEGFLARTRRVAGRA